MRQNRHQKLHMIIAVVFVLFAIGASSSRAPKCSSPAICKPIFIIINYMKNTGKITSMT